MKTLICKVNAEKPEQDIISQAGKILREGGLVAFPTETVYGLGGNALDAAASEKNLCCERAAVRQSADCTYCSDGGFGKNCDGSPEEKQRYWLRHVGRDRSTMILPKSEEVPYETTGGLDSVAVRYPSHPVAQALILAAGGFVAAPSANTSGKAESNHGSSCTGRFDRGGGYDFGRRPM